MAHNNARRARPRKAARILASRWFAPGGVPVGVVVARPAPRRDPVVYIGVAGGRDRHKDARFVVRYGEKITDPLLAFALIRATAAPPRRR